MFIPGVGDGMYTCLENDTLLYGFMSSISEWDISSHVYKLFGCMIIFSMYSLIKNDTNNHLLFSSFIE